MCVAAMWLRHGGRGLGFGEEAKGEADFSTFLFSATFRPVTLTQPFGKLERCREGTRNRGTGGGGVRVPVGCFVTAIGYNSNEQQR